MFEINNAQDCVLISRDTLWYIHLRICFGLGTVLMMQKTSAFGRQLYQNNHRKVCQWMIIQKVSILTENCFSSQEKFSVILPTICSSIFYSKAPKLQYRHNDIEDMTERP